MKTLLLSEELPFTNDIYTSIHTRKNGGVDAQRDTKLGSKIVRALDAHLVSEERTV